MDMNIDKSQVQSNSGHLPDSRWYLAYTKPRAEQIARLNLAQQNFDTYLPMYKKNKATDQGFIDIFEPMFPRYIFFRPSHEGQSLSTVSYTKGISNVVRFGFEPAYLQDDAIESIRQIETHRNQISLKELNSLKSGQAVLLKNSALNGLEGVIQDVSSKRVMVLLEILGRPNLVAVAHHQVQPAF